jgi:predicted transcriptional regulator
MTQHTLIVTVESLEAVRDRTADAFEQALAAAGPTNEPPRRLSFETTDQLAQVFTPRAIDLLQAIAREEPASIREAARLVDRDVKQVSENLERLAAYDVVEFVEEGRAKRPIVPFDEIDIRLPLRDAVEMEPATAG